MTQLYSPPYEKGSCQNLDKIFNFLETKSDIFSPLQRLPSGPPKLQVPGKPPPSLHKSLHMAPLGGQLYPRQPPDQLQWQVGARRGQPARPAVHP